MPKNVDVDPERVQVLLESGGLKPETLKKRARMLECLTTFLEEFAAGNAYLANFVHYTILSL